MLKNQTNTLAAQTSDVKQKLQTSKQKASRLRGLIVEVSRELTTPSYRKLLQITKERQRQLHASLHLGSCLPQPNCPTVAS